MVLGLPPVGVEEEASVRVHDREEELGRRVERRSFSANALDSMMMLRLCDDAGVTVTERERVTLGISESCFFSN